MLYALELFCFLKNVFACVGRINKILHQSFCYFTQAVIYSCEQHIHFYVLSYNLATTVRLQPMLSGVPLLWK